MDSAKDAGMVEAVARAAQVFIDEAARQMGAASEGLDDIPANEREQFLACIGAIVPLIEAQVIERCAKIADRVAAECADDARNLRLAGDSQGGVDAAAGARVEAGRIARMIRALALSPAGDAGGGEK
jgi:hypothetical protein